MSKKKKKESCFTCNDLEKHENFAECRVLGWIIYPSAYPAAKRERLCE